MHKNQHSPAAVPALPPRPAPPRRLGRHHFAHLRCVAEGVPIEESARRYLGIDHGLQAHNAHRRVVEQLRSLSRRRGDTAWRLIGLTIRLPGQPLRPSLEDFIDERELHGWSEVEVQQLYADAYPTDHKAARRQRLRERQLELLRQLEQVAAETPQATDRIDGWFDPGTARRLMGAGLLLLADLQAHIRPGGRWWQALPAIGRIKALRIAQHLETLLPPQPHQAEPVFTRPQGLGESPPSLAKRRPASASARQTPPTPLPDTPATWPASTPGEMVWELRADVAPAPLTWQPTATDSAEPALPPGQLISARTDAHALEAWVAARAGSEATARSYRREGLRLLLWLNQERNRGYRELTVEDCLAYMAFLAHLPPEWISRRHRTVLGAGWAPFRGPLSVASQRQAVLILGGLFGWLVQVGYLPGRNPWLLVNRHTGDDPNQHQLDSRAFTPETWATILAHLHAQAPCASRDRMLFLLAFTEATGLRASELVSTTLGAFRRHKGRWALQVQGKGAKNRVVAIPGQAEAALDAYLHARNLPPLGAADPATPLLASTRDPATGIGYQALYQTMKRWVREAIRASDLPRTEREIALRASPHWLRHTFGTRALERKAPLEVVQRQLGHADPRTTMRYAKTQLERLQAEMDAAFGTLPGSALTH